MVRDPGADLPRSGQLGAERAQGQRRPRDRPVDLVGRALTAFTDQRRDGLVLSADPTRLDHARIRAWLAASYWAAGRPAELVDRSVANSLTCGVYEASAGQVGFARMVTDEASFAWLSDVIVDEPWRGRGIGRWMVSTLVDHLREVGVARFVLATRDAHGVYAALGFVPLHYPERWMEIDLRGNPVGSGGGTT